MKRIIFLIFTFSFFLMHSAQERVLQVFDGENYLPISWDDIDKITYKDGELQFLLDNGQLFPVSFSDGMNIVSAETIPLIEITTDEFLEEIPNKTDYKSGSFKLTGFGSYEDLEKQVEIKGRGNTSWQRPKKPYRLKFDKKISICGLPAAKSYVLLANYTDESLIQNALAFEIGRLLSLPYTNFCVPVDVTLNGIYKGSYLLTNKPGINSGSVNIDEDNSIMWELDLAMDEDRTFRSPLLDLPVMVVDPDLTDEKFEYWKADFIKMEKAAVQKKASDLVDMDALARYILVNEILKNDEIGWPKSVKLYKTEGGKYIFGPIWDFDHSMGHIWNGESYTTEDINKGVWKNKLFYYLSLDEEYNEYLLRYWKLLKLSLPYILNYIEKYKYEIYHSAIRDCYIWNFDKEWELSIDKMKSWLIARFEALDNIIK